MFTLIGSRKSLSLSISLLAINCICERSFEKVGQRVNDQHMVTLITSNSLIVMISMHALSLFFLSFAINDIGKELSVTKKLAKSERSIYKPWSLLERLIHQLPWSTISLCLLYPCLSLSFQTNHISHAREIFGDTRLPKSVSSAYMVTLIKLHL